MADTFDILLFTCNTAGGKVIRTYSGSEYDHAAMVLKFGAEPQEVFFMEATGNIGVGLKRFSGMKQALGSFYKKIVIRHLEWERPDGALEKLEQFVNEVQGAQYQFKISQLAKRQTVNFDSTKYKNHEESKNKTREASNSEVQR